MSDHGPYQSRLLNFLVLQYRRLVEKGDRAIRQMKVAASWAAQIVIYPVYLLLQTTRLAFRQLGQAVRSQIPQLRASVEAADGYDVDTPIGQVLQAALPEELVLTPEVVRSQSPKPNGPQHWVRIVNNTPLVSPKQGLKADRLPEATPLPVDPRGGYKGQVIRGLATELTGKNIVLVTADNQELDIFTVQQQKELQQLIIWQLAKYRRHLQLAATGKRPPTWGKLAARKTTLLPIRLLGQVMAWEQQGTVARTIDLFGESSLVHQPRTDRPQAEPEAIAYLSKLDSFIASLEKGISIIGEGPTAIEGKTKEITSSPTQAESVTKKQHIFALGSAIGYLFGSQGVPQHSPDPEEVPTGTVKEDWVTCPDRVGTPAKMGQKQAEAQGSGATAAPLMVARTADREQQDRQYAADNIYIDLTPDWIETAATPSGYVKHPLEQILSWLDRGILWLEDRALGIWKWFRG